MGRSGRIAQFGDASFFDSREILSMGQNMGQKR